MVLRHRFSTLLLILLFAVSGVVANTRQTRQEYIDRYKHIAVEHMSKFGIPASITMAQGILESDSGNSPLAAKSNNHFGIKCKSYWTGATVTHDDDEKGECFRAYSSVEQSYEDHALFLDSSSRYDFLFDYSSSDYKSWARGLKKAGYATAPDYADRVIKIIEDGDLYILDQEDGIEKYIALHGGSVPPAGVFTPTQGAGVDVNNYAVTINGHKGYGVFRKNGVFFTFAKSGDTYKSIAQFFDISERRLRAYNDVPRKAVIEAGDVVYIAKKRSSWREGNAVHTVVEGETMHSVAQDYAIRVSALRRLNKYDVKYTIEVGQNLKLR